MGNDTKWTDVVMAIAAIVAVSFTILTAVVSASFFAGTWYCESKQGAAVVQPADP